MTYFYSRYIHTHTEPGNQGIIYRTFRQHIAPYLCCFAPLFKSDVTWRELAEEVCVGRCAFTPALPVADICGALVRGRGEHLL